MSKKPETLADLKAKAARLRAENDKMFTDAKKRLDEVERAIEEREAQERDEG